MYKSLKGMPDILPLEVGRWQALEKKMRDVLNLFNYQEIRTPLLEPTELFSRSIGTATDVVEKEMYTFSDKDGDSISLRPEGTASVIRSFVENHLGHGNDFLKLFYIGPMFRHERPQKGRLRQFSQMGVEAIGNPEPAVDADVLLLAMTLMNVFEIPNARLELNSVGDKECRPPYREKLKLFLKKIQDSLCEYCKQRIETNPLRVLDCKNEACKLATKEAPLMVEHLCTGCKEHFTSVQELLQAAKVPFEMNPRIVRGLDYYTRTAFEVVAGNLGSQNAVLAGGRYDGLTKELGGDPTPAVGFATGLERLLLSSQKIVASPLFRIDLIPLDKNAEGAGLQLAKQIRLILLENNMAATVEHWPAGQNLKNALRKINKLNSQIAVILGENELKNQKAMVKDLAQHAQSEVDFAQVGEHVLGVIRGSK